MGEEKIPKELFTGRITSGIKPRTLQLAIINFVKDQLPLWRDDPERRPLEQSEIKLNTQLSKFLNGEARKSFPMILFNHEEPQSGTRSIDISVSLIESQMYSKYDSVLVLECKRLPAPTAQREKEYVSSQSTDSIAGGIQRFKLGLHGAKHDFAVMIGYIQKGTSDYWLTKVNSWILELVNNPIEDGCVWYDDEFLKESGINKLKDVNNYKSFHTRACNKSGTVELHHIWITMNQA